MDLFIFLALYRALVKVGSMDSFEPMDFWKLLNLTHYYSQKKEFMVQYSKHIFMDELNSIFGGKGHGIQKD